MQNRAKELFDRYCDYLEKIGFSVEKSVESREYVIVTEGQGKNLPVSLTVRIHREFDRMLFISRLPFSMKKGMLLEGSVATSIVNNILVVGNFDYDIHTGDIYYRYSFCIYSNALPNEETLESVTRLVMLTVDQYNDKFLMLSDGKIPIEKFQDYVLDNL